MIQNNPKWDTVSLEGRKTSEGPIAVGATWRAVAKLLSQRIESEAEVTEYESNRISAMKSTSGPLPVQVRTTFEPVEGGTRVNLKIEGEPGGFFKVAEPLLISMVKGGLETDFANLKDLMEAHAL